eukprot:23686-Eustigmatos_ZCMA.PRE.1
MQRHFTVMDYAGYDVDVPKETDFLAQFEREHGVPFAAVDAKVRVGPHVIIRNSYRVATVADVLNG